MTVECFWENKDNPPGITAIRVKTAHASIGSLETIRMGMGRNIVYDVLFFAQMKYKVGPSEPDKTQWVVIAMSSDQEASLVVQPGGPSFSKKIEGTQCEKLVFTASHINQVGLCQPGGIDQPVWLCILAEIAPFRMKGPQWNVFCLDKKNYDISAEHIKDLQQSTGSVQTSPEWTMIE